MRIQLEGLKKTMALFAIGCFLLTSTGGGPACADIQDVFDTMETQDVYLYRGDLVSLKVYSLTRIAVSNPGIIEIANADVDELLVVGQTVGETTLFVWDEYGKRQIFVRVLETDLDEVIKRIDRLLVSAGIEGIILKKNIYERKIVVTGNVLEHQKEKLEKVLGGFSSHLIDMTNEDADLIQIDVQISELSTTLTKALGIDWSAGATGGFAFAYPETMPNLEPGLKDLFKIGDFKRTTAINATVNALIAEGEARVLSKPSVVVSSGEQVTFLVGGEIPVRTTTTSTGGTSVQENVTYTSYGIDVSIKPEIKNDKIDIDLNVQIRDIDASNAVGENVAFTTRNAQTKLLLNDGQTIVLAGLIKQNKAETMTGVPFLRRVPIVGMLFRNKNWPTDSEQEVVISMTPRIVTQKEMDLDSEEVMAKYQTATEAADDMEDMQDSEDPELESDFQEMEDTESTAAEEDLKGEIMDEEEALSDSAGEAAPEPLSAATIPESSIEEEKTETPESLAVPQAQPAATTEEREEEPTEELSPVAGQEDTGASSAMTGYVQNVQQKIARAISYPFEAKEKGWSGTVTLSLVLLSDGSLNDVSVKESSGHEVFDKDAVNTAKILAPFEPFPPELNLEELVVSIPIVYSQEAIYEGAETN